MLAQLGFLQFGFFLAPCFLYFSQGICGGKLSFATNNVSFENDSRLHTVMLAVIHLPSGFFGRFRIYILSLRVMISALSIMGFFLIFLSKPITVLAATIFFIYIFISATMMIVSIRSVASRIAAESPGRGGLILENPLDVYVTTKGVNLYHRKKSYHGMISFL